MRSEEITTPKGDTWLNTLPVLDSDGVAYDLTDASVTLTVKEMNDRADDDTLALFQLTLGDGIAIDSPSTGVISIEMSDERTNLLAAGKSYAYDVQIRKNQQTFTPIGGKLVVTRDITRS